MPQFETRAGFCISEAKLQLVEVAFNGAEFFLQNINEVYFDEPLLMNEEKETKSLSLLQTAYNELILSTPLSTNQVSFSLPLNLFKAVQLPFDNSLLYKDLMYEFQWEFSVMFPHINKDEFVIQFYEIEKNFFVNENNAIVVAILRKYLKTILDFCKKNQLRLTYIDNVHFAADRSLIANSVLNQDAVVMSLCLAQNILSVEMLFYGKPFYVKWFSIKNVMEIVPSIKSALTAIPLLKHDQINYAVHIGDDFMPALVSQIEQNLGLTLKPINPFALMNLNEEIVQKNRLAENAHRFSSAAGIAYRIS